MAPTTNDEHWPYYVIGLGQSIYWKAGYKVFLDYDSWENLLLDYAEGILFLSHHEQYGGPNDPFPHSFVCSEDPEWPSLEQIVNDTLS